ncbi:MAG: asparaginase domain-containing protein [Bacteroidota bacterium]|nr:asparaginase domain-containing protein [Bacteroidota bacterium]MDE2955579.1 asparaginase domain-containing protein [Bacteroidota bacterium]
MEPILILTTGGTIDKVYHDARSSYRIGEPQVTNILANVNVLAPYTVEILLQKDSLDLTDTDRTRIRERVLRAGQRRIVITHGTDTMITTARCLGPITDKTVVFVGSLMPALFRATDAEFNIGFAMAAAQSLSRGVYLAMNGQVFDPRRVRKNSDENRFEII